MRISTALLGGILIVTLACAITHVHSAAKRSREMTIRNVTTCKNNRTSMYLLKFEGPLNFTSRNSKVFMYGNFTILEQIRGPLEIALIVHRCTMDMKSCQSHNRLQVPKICSFINDETGFWSPFVKSVEPSIRCPIQPGIYHFKDSSFDLSFFTNFPLDGYSWQVMMKLYSTAEARKKEVFCCTVQATINTMTRRQNAGG